MADLSKYIQAQRFSLAVGISTTDTSITLSSFNFPSGEAIAAGDLGAINYGTLEPATTREEIISFTGMTSNADGTVTLTGVTRGLGFGAVDTYSEQSNLKVQHGAGATFVISNNPAFYDRFVNKYNDEEISGTLTVPTPTASGHAATKAYVDATAIGGATIDNVIVAGTAGQSVAAGDLVYYDDTDNEWKKTDADTATTIDNVLLGIAQGAGSDGGNIDGGVLTFGVDANQTGLTVGVKLYASNTAGEIVESAGTNEKVIGWAKSATEVYFDPYHGELPTSGEKDAMSGGGDFGAPSNTNKYITETYLDNAVDIQEFTSSGTWTKPSVGTYALIELIGAGGSGGAARRDDNAGAQGGSGGAYQLYLVPLSQLSSTETVTIGAGGAARTVSSATTQAGANGSATTFKNSYFTAAGGTGGAVASGSSVVDISISSLLGGSGSNKSQNEDGGAAGGVNGFSGGAAAGSNTTFSGPGGGSASATTSTQNSSAGGTSLLSSAFGGDGAQTTSGTATAEAGVRGGGGGGAAGRTVNATTITSGAGGNGFCRVTVI